MPELRQYNLFISHPWHNGDQYTKFCALLDAAKNFRYRDYSVEETKPLPDTSEKRLSQGLEEQISHATCVIVFAGMYVKYRSAIQKEIKIAQKQGKYILAVRPLGQERIPQELQDAASELVAWNTESIVQAIRNSTK